MSHRFFFNRRSGVDRRTGRDQRLNPRLDLSHKRRRKPGDRRDLGRTDADDYYATNNSSQQNHVNQLPENDDL